jgi:endonuclease/exonuclease/phosphatase family metal-dependent hydrolase
MRIVTYNVLGLQGYPPGEALSDVGSFGGEAHIDHYVGVFKELDADILALEEGVTAAMMKGIAQRLEYHLATFASPTAFPGHVLSRYPILESRTFSHFDPGVEVVPFSRTAGAALLSMGEERVWVVVVHLHPGDVAMREREAGLLKGQLEKLMEVAKRILVLGDFNCDVEEQMHGDLKALGFANAMETVGGGVQLTMDTVGVGQQRIDHIYASPALKAGLRSAEVIRRPGFRHDGPQVEGLWVHSDHLPVMAELAVKSAE